MTPEQAWTVTSAAGALVAAWGVFDAVADLHAVGPIANGRRRIAKGYVRAEAIRLAIQVSWVVIGAIALLDDRAAPWSPAVVILVLTNAGLLANSLLDGIDRLRLRALIGPDR